MSDRDGSLEAKGIDLSRILYQPDMPEHVGRYCQVEQDHGIERSLDMTQLLPACAPPSSAASVCS